MSTSINEESSRRITHRSHLPTSKSFSSSSSEFDGNEIACSMRFPFDFIDYSDNDIQIFSFFFFFSIYLSHLCILNISLHALLFDMHFQRGKRKFDRLFSILINLPKPKFYAFTSSCFITFFLGFSLLLFVFFRQSILILFYSHIFSHARIFFTDKLEVILHISH